MSNFLKTDENPDGHRLEDIFVAIRKELILRSTKIVDDNRSEAKLVLDNDIKILSLLSQCIDLAEESTRILNKSFGPHQTGKPRIGVA